MKNIFITTTNQIENNHIEKYIELVSTNVVIGTNIFSDLGAAFTDIFGGYSGTYQNKLQNIYGVAIKNLKEKAARLGGNAIIGLKVDFDEIAGSGKSMFMVSAIGMVVVISNNKTKSDNETTYIDDSELEYELMKLDITNTLDYNGYLNHEQWLYVFNNPCEYFSETLLHQYLNLESINENYLEEEEVLLINNIQILLSISDADKMSSILYQAISEKPERVYELMHENKLFSPELTFQLMESGKFNEAILTLDSSKRQYTQEDLAWMKKLCDCFDNLPDLGKIKEVNRLIGKTRDKYTCPNGHENEPDDEFCKREDCQLNIKGLQIEQVYKIDKLKVKVEVLSNLLKVN